MRLGSISLLILMGCGRPRDPEMEIVRLPQAAYGPFDASPVKVVAADSGSNDAAVKDIPSSQVDCYVPDAPLDDEEVSAAAPFDNCPAQHEGGRFNEKATSQRRTSGRNRDTCCYSIVRRKQHVTHVPEE